VENVKYHTVTTVLKTNRKVIETETNLVPPTHLNT